MGARDDPGARLARLRAQARALLWAERLLAALLPAIMVAGVYIAAALIGFANGWVGLAALALAAGLLVRSARRLRLPSAAEADRRIEAASRLRHHPLAAIDDRPAVGDAAMFALYQERARAALASARTGGLAPVMSTADPYALRGAGILLVIAGLVIAGAAAPQRLAAAFAWPAWPFAGPLVEAWVTPPAYTGQPPKLLKPGEAVSVLTGSHLGVILSGSTARIAYAGAALAGPAPADDARHAEGTITRSGRLLIGPWWHRIAAWDIKAVPPSAPTLSLLPPSERGNNVQFTYDAEDAYGFSSLAVSITPVGAPDALPEGAALALKTGISAASVNEADSPYAGLAVAVTLKGENLAGMTAVAPPRQMVLHPASLHDATARALAALRQNLALHPDAPAKIGTALAALSRAPPSAITYAADLQIAALAAALASHESRAAASVDRLAALIHEIEQGPTYAADQAFAQAARELSDTLKNGGTSAQLNAALQKLAQALAAKLNQAGTGKSPGQAPSGGQNFDASGLQRMAQQIAADERAGNMAKARQELAQLEKTLQQLQNAQVMTPEQQKRAQAATAAQSALSQLIQGQGQQLDKTGQGTATPAAQGQLRAGLNALRQSLAPSGLGPLIPGLGAAGRAMAQAQRSLAQGQNDAAASAEAKAIAQMQQAAAALKNAAGTTVNFAASPAGAQSGVNGNGQDEAIPGLDLDQSSPARKIQQEIMHRDADPSLAPGTHDYLHRLLNP